MYFSLFLSLLCLLGLAQGQSSIVATPSNRIAVGENITITCDSGNVALPPSLRIDDEATNENSRVSPLDSSSATERVFLFSSVTKSDDGIVFSCANVVGSFTLEVLFMPEIQANISDITVDNGGSAAVSFTVDANPAITRDNITVTVGGQSVYFTASIDGNMVNLTLSNLQTTGQYTVNVANSVGMGSFNFQVNVMPVTSTSMSTILITSSMTISTSTLSSSSSSVIDSSTMTRPSSTAVATATPGATNEPANSAVGVQASVLLLAVLMIFIVFVMH